MQKFNELQEVVVNTCEVCGGVFGLAMQESNEFQKVLHECDVRDGLFEFIDRELGDDVLDITDAILRMERVRAEVEEVLQGLHALKKQKVES